MSASSDERRARILNAAALVFARYGYQRTSMADIAEAAGVSRPAIYLVFQNKEDVFRSLSEDLLAKSLHAAAEALTGGAPLGERMTRALLTYEEPLFEVVHNSPHGNELVDANATLAADATRKAGAKLVRLIAAAIRSAQAEGRADLSGIGIRPREFAELLLASVVGFKNEAATINEFRRRVKTVSAIFANSIVPAGPRATKSRRRAI